MKIIICTMFDIPHVGGASTHIELLRDALSKKNFDVVLINGNDARLSFFERLKYLMFRTVNKDVARAMLLRNKVNILGRRIKREVETSNSQVVIHSHDPLATCAASHAVGMTVAIVQTVHGPWSNESSGVIASAGGRYVAEIASLEKAAFERADKLIPVDIGQSNLLRESNIDLSKITIIENAVDLDQLRISGCQDSTLVIGEKSFLVPRRLVPKNGVEFAIRALNYTKNNNIKLIIAGGGPLLRSLNDLVEELGLCSRVQFIGDVARKDLLPIMKNCKGIIVPSVPFNGVVEATSLAVLEGMGIGVPVIGSAIGGIRDIIMDDRYGLLTEPSNSAEIAMAMDSVAEQTSVERKALVNRATERIDKFFGADAWVEKIINVYRSSIRRQA